MRRDTKLGSSSKCVVNTNFTKNPGAPTGFWFCAAGHASPDPAWYHRSVVIGVSGRVLQGWLRLRVPRRWWHLAMRKPGPGLLAARSPSRIGSRRARCLRLPASQLTSRMCFAVHAALQQLGGFGGSGDVCFTRGLDLEPRQGPAMHEATTACEKGRNYAELSASRAAGSGILGHESPTRLRMCGQILHPRNAEICTQPKPRVRTQALPQASDGLGCELWSAYPSWLLISQKVCNTHLHRVLAGRLVASRRTSSAAETSRR